MGAVAHHWGWHDLGGVGRLINVMQFLTMNVSQPASSMKLQSRCTQRITITVPYSIFQLLISKSFEEGRSLSNLAAFLLEKTLLHSDNK